MNWTLLKKSLNEARLLFGGLGLLLFVFCWLRVFIVSRLQTSQFAAIVEQLWDQFKDFWPVSLEQLLSYTGRIAVGYNEPIIVFGVSLFAIARGSDVVSGELGRGTLEQVYIKGEKGYVVLMSVGEEAVLTALAREQAKLGLIFLDIKRAAEDLAKLI